MKWLIFLKILENCQYVKKSDIEMQLNSNFQKDNEFSKGPDRNFQKMFIEIQ